MADCTKCANRNNDYCIFACNGENFKPITNYDRIRAKSVEEMAEWIMSIEPAACPFRDDHGDDCQFSHCKDCWIDWLKQEVSEE